jgi:hypothetical protein
LWFRPKTEPILAVCIPPGARLMLRNIPERLQRRLAVGPVEEFIRATERRSYTYRDAVRFRTDTRSVPGADRASACWFWISLCRTTRTSHGSCTLPGVTVGALVRSLRVGFSPLESPTMSTTEARWGF